LANLYYRSGRLKEAEPLFKRSIALSEKIYGPEHIKTGNSLGGLASSFYGTGRYAEAEPLFKRSLAIYEKFYEAEDANIAGSLLGMALMYEPLSKV